MYHGIERPAASMILSCIYMKQCMIEWQLEVGGLTNMDQGY